MRIGPRRHRREEDEESAFVSMTDMTVSFLFIVIILLAFFASQFSDEETVPRSRHEQVVSERDAARQALTVRTRERDVALEAATVLTTERDAAREATTARTLERDAARAAVAALTAEREVLRQDITRLDATVAEQAARIRDLEARLRALEEKLRALAPEDALESYLGTIAAERQRVLETLQERLKLDFPDLQVMVSPEMDALRFKGDGLFQRGSSTLAEDKRAIVRTIAERLNEILPCYTLGARSRWQPECNPVGALVEAIQIEGHTDSDGQDAANMILSTARANETFFAMTEAEPELTEHRNRLGQPVLSVAGYGEMRPVADNATAEGKATNRRIDLRLIMDAPGSEEEVARVRAALRQGTLPGARP